MDAVEIMRTYSRMCDVEGTKGCVYCGLSYSANGTGEPCKEFIKNSPEKAVDVIKKWSVEHPIKTRQSEFLKMFPNASIAGGVPELNPCHVDNKFSPQKGCGNSSCADCRKEYWSEEVE